MTLPLHVLRRFVEPGGNRLSKFKPFMNYTTPVARGGPAWGGHYTPSAGAFRICAVCHKSVELIKLNGVESLDGHYRGTEYFHRGCFPAGHPRPKDVRVPKGNIGDEEYRFWVGTYREISCSQFAMCRACRASTYCKAERDKHLKDEKMTIGGLRCAARLSEAYKHMLSLPECIICHKSRYSHSKWGIPICASNDCIRRWKFDQDRWVALESELHMQVKKAEWLAKRANVPANTRKWCVTCEMFEDNEAHSEIHEAWAGKFHNDDIESEN